MKTLMFAFCLAGATAVNAQDISQTEVPSLVLNTFQSKYPTARDIDWEIEGDLYKVDFEIGNRDHDLWIDKNGKVTKHKEEIVKSELPSAIAQKIKSEFKQYTIDDVDKIERDGKVLFKVDLDSKSGDREVTFNNDGTIAQTDVR